MEIFTASEVKQAFGEVLLKAQKSPVGINKNGKPVAVMVSADDYEEYRHYRLKMELEKGLLSAEEGRVVEGKAAFDSLRERIKNA